MPLTDNDWQDILEDIAEQKAVLLIGPEIMRFEGKPMNRHLRDTLFAQNQADIAYYYERDGLFLFASPEGKVRVARQVKRFYRNLPPDEAILKQVVEIPFHLLVSLNPDTFLSEAFYRHGVKHRFHYFQHHNRANENDEIERPGGAMPLVYNLFGSKDQDDSLILDYNDVYKMLQSAFGTSSLPNKFLRAFRDARTYIFLGFQFDKWYSQLLLKFLSDDAAKDKLIAVRAGGHDADTEGFVIRQFQIQFMGDQFDFFGELHRRCQAAGKLRRLDGSGACPQAVEVKQRIANAELHDALEVLHQALRGKEKENEVVALKARHNKLLDDFEKGVLDSRDYRTELNRIIDAMLELVKHVCR